MQRQTDDQIAIELIDQTRVRYPALRVCSFDKGFHSPENQVELAKKLDRVVVPKRGGATSRSKSGRAAHNSRPADANTRRWSRESMRWKCMDWIDVWIMESTDSNVMWPWQWLPETFRSSALNCKRKPSSRKSEGGTETSKLLNNPLPDPGQASFLAGRSRPQQIAHTFDLAFNLSKVATYCYCIYNSLWLVQRPPWDTQWI